MKKRKRKTNMYDTQLDYIKVLIDNENYTDAIEKLDFIKSTLNKKIKN